MHRQVDELVHEKWSKRKDQADTELRHYDPCCDDRCVPTGLVSIRPNARIRQPVAGVSHVNHDRGEAKAVVGESEPDAVTVFDGQSRLVGY